MPIQDALAITSVAISGITLSLVSMSWLMARRVTQTVLKEADSIRDAVTRNTNLIATISQLVPVLTAELADSQTAVTRREREETRSAESVEQGDFVSLLGVWRGLEVSDDEIEAAKRSLFPKNET